MGLGFKGGFAAYMSGYNQAQEKERQAERQKKLDDMTAREFESNQSIREGQAADAKQAREDAKGAREAVGGVPAVPVAPALTPKSIGVEFDGTTYSEAPSPVAATAPVAADAKDASSQPVAMPDAKPKMAPPRPDAGFAAASSYNEALRTDPAARAERLANYWGSKGNFEKETQIRNAASQGKITAIQLKAAEDAQARENFNATTLDAFRTNGVFNGAAKIMSDTNALSAEGAKFEAVPSKDGKSMSFYKTDAKGNRTLVDVYPNTKEGELALTQKFLKVPTDKVVEWHTDALKRATDTERWDKEFGQRDKQIAAQQEIARGQLAISGGHLSLARAEEGRKTRAFAEDSKTPMGVKMAYGSLEASAKAMDAALYKAQSDGSFNPDSPATQALLKQRAAVSLRMSELLDPYIPDKAASPAKNPANVLGYPGPAAVAPAPAASKPRMTAADVMNAARSFAQ